MNDLQDPQPTAVGETRRPLTLPKSERLRHRQLVEANFAHGESIYEFPIRLCWHACSQQQAAGLFRNGLPPLVGPLQVMITIPKRKRRHAVDRVLMRRRIREAYRLQRLPLKDLVVADGGIRTLSLSFIYLKNENVDSAEISRKMGKILARLARRLSRQHEADPARENTSQAGKGEQS